MIDYTPVMSAWLSDLWLLQPPYDELTPLRVHDSEYAYCCAAWSPDGERMAYVRTSLDSPASIVWVWNVHEDTHEQVGGSRSAAGLPFGVRSIWIYGWSPDGSYILLYSNGLFSLPYPGGGFEPVKLETVLPEIWMDIADPIPHLAQYSQSASRMVFWRTTEGEWVVDAYGGGHRTPDLLHFAYVSLGEAAQPQIVQLFDPSPEFAPVDPANTLRSAIGLTAGTSISPKGDQILFAGREPTEALLRLWLYDVDSERWSLISEHEPPFYPDTVAWSPNGEWAAWWEAGPGGYAIAFLDTHDWSVTREVDKPYHPGNVIIRWTMSPDGTPYFGVLEPEDGLILYNPHGSRQADVTLAPFDLFETGLPFAPNEAQSWTWQP